MGFGEGQFGLAAWCVGFLGSVGYVGAWGVGFGGWVMYFEPGRSGFAMILGLGGLVLGLGMVGLGVWVLDMGRDNLGLRRGVWGVWAR